MKKRVLFTSIALIVLSTLLISLSSAEISISQPSSIYNLGDKFILSISVSSTEDISSFLSATLKCSSGNDLEIYRNVLSLDINSQKSVDFDFKLSPTFIGNLEGNCNVAVNFDSQTKSSQSFKISRDIEIDSSINGLQFNPSDNLIIEGKAIKENGQEVNGFIEVKSSSLNISILSEITEGNFKVLFKLPENSKSGDHEISLHAYDRESNEIKLNTGDTTGRIKVNQILKKLQIAVSEQNLIPGDKLSYSIIAEDQAGDNMLLEISTKISSPSRIIQEKISQSSENLEFETQTNFENGNWEIGAVYSNLIAKKIFYLEKLALAEYSISGEILTITNKGNVPYDKPLEINIGQTKKVLETSLGVGESKEFKITAPTGDYDIEITDGTNTLSTSTFLTGKAIDIKDPNSIINSSLLSTILWIIIILLLIGILYYAYKKISKRKFSASTPKIFPKNGFRSLKSESYSSKENVNSGNKESAGVIALKIKNLSELESKRNSTALSTIDSALLKARSSKAKIYVSEPYRIIIFAESLTGEKDNSLRAANLAREIKLIIDSHNNSNPLSKIKYGLGIQSGDLIVESSKDSNFRFTSIGSVISSVKNLAEQSNSDIIVSEPLKSKLLGKIKTEKITDKLWKLVDLKSKYHYEEFINKFNKNQSN